MGWSALVDAVQRFIAAAGDTLGDPLAGIFAVTFGLRLALIPLMLPLAIRARERMRIMERMRPEMRALKEQFRKEPDRLQKEIEALHARNGLRLIDVPALLGALVQLPVLIALFQAVYHLSEGTSLATGGLLMGVVASAVSVLSVVLAGQGKSKPMLALAAVLPIVVSIWLGRGIGAYLVAFYLGATIQGLLMQRRRPVAEPAATA